MRWSSDDMMPLPLRAYTMLKHGAGRFRPRIVIAYIVVRDLRAPIPSEPQSRLSDVEVWDISSPDDPRFERLVKLSVEAGVSRKSCERQLNMGGRASVAEVGAKPVALSWMTFGDVFVPMIGSTFQGQGDSCFLYGDFVLPEFRGNRLQRLLGQHRLKQACEAGKRWGYGYILRGNTPSLSSALRRGFKAAATVHQFCLGDKTLPHVRLLGKPPWKPLRFQGWQVRHSFFVNRSPLVISPAESAS